MNRARDRDRDYHHGHHGRNQAHSHDPNPVAGTSRQHPGGPTPPTRYCQIGGFHGTNWVPRDYDYRRLAEDIAGARSPLVSPQGEVELVLGIKRNGTSHLLITTGQAQRLRLRLPEHRFVGAGAFTSLSPIIFNGSLQLQLKLAALKPSGGKCDNSRANKSYAIDPDGAAPERWGFEHSRVLYRLLSRNPRDHAFLDKFGLPETFGSRLRVVAVAANTWVLDDRPRDDQKKTPNILDIGWVQLPHSNVSTLSGTNLSPHTEHLIVEDHKLKRNRNTDRKELAVTEQITHAEVADRVQAIFCPRASELLVVLVHDEPNAIIYTSHVLQALGVDISRWKSSMAELYTTGPPSRESSPRRDDRRSRDPRLAPRAEPRDGGAVYIINVLQLAHCILPKEISTIRTLAHTLHFQLELNQMCAGEEAQLLFEMWVDIAKGMSVDERHACHPVRSATPPINSATRVQRTQRTEDNDDSGSESDPNLSSRRAELAPEFPRSVTHDPYDDLGTDDEEGYE